MSHQQPPAVSLQIRSQSQSKLESVVILNANAVEVPMRGQLTQAVNIVQNEFPSRSEYGQSSQQQPTLMVLPTKTGAMCGFLNVQNHQARAHLMTTNLRDVTHTILNEEESQTETPISFTQNQQVEIKSVKTALLE